MSTSPPPIPIRGQPLTITEKMLRSRLVQGGITGPISTDLQAVCNALRVLEAQKPQLRKDALVLAAAFNKWLNGNHPGELQVLMPSQAFQGIRAFVARYPVPNAPPGPAPTGLTDSWLKSVGVALFTVPNADFNFKLSLDERLLGMRRAVATFNNWLGSVNQDELQLDNAFLGIFVAPEYYFTTPNPKGQRKFLNSNSKIWLDAQLKQLSSAFPKILLVPGTIHYDVEMSDEDKVQTGYQLLKAAKDRILREKALATPRTVLERSMHHAPSGPFSKVPSMNEMATNLLAPNTRPRKVHNVTSLLLNGQSWGTYDKHSDFYESKSISPDRSMFVPGTQDECPEIGSGMRKFRFGTEICFDHANAVLKSRAPANLQFHIVVSDYVDTIPEHMAMRNGGYFLHASTNYAESVVYRRENGNPVNLKGTLPWRSFTYGPGSLDMALIKLPVPLPPPVPPRP